MASHGLFRRFFCFNTRTGTLIIGTADIVFSLICLVICIVSSILAGEYLLLLYAAELWYILAWLMVRGMMSSVFAGLMIHAVRNTSRPSWMLPWLIWGGVSMAGGLMFVFIATVGTAAAKFQPIVSVVICIILTLCLITGILLYLVPYSHYQVMLERAVPDHEDGFSVLPLRDMGHDPKAQDT
ncbi:unnamed protein product [Darwinula stevensoni]|uniref:Uncharacterized protein n=1 Tax=Darwinula stevensoni TaxID=69355 RepID=A0A7R8XGL9_9CRUS|nr:unnamed protein product [Darwinula stevensoni]CAG0891811.1 unnamed protein product [Darwinula stevensoni]